MLSEVDTGATVDAGAGGRPTAGGGTRASQAPRLASPSEKAVSAHARPPAVTPAPPTALWCGRAVPRVPGLVGGASGCPHGPRSRGWRLLAGESWAPLCGEGAWGSRLCARCDVGSYGLLHLRGRLSAMWDFQTPGSRRRHGL